MKIYRGIFSRQQKTKLLLETDPKEVTEDSFLNLEEFNKILKHTSKSSSGPDQISYQLLKALPKNIKAFTCIIISSSINNSYVPCLWKDYRPISLTNCIAKV